MHPGAHVHAKASLTVAGPCVRTRPPKEQVSIDSRTHITQTYNADMIRQIHEADMVTSGRHTCVHTRSLKEQRQAPASTMGVGCVSCRRSTSSLSSAST